MLLLGSVCTHCKYGGIADHSLICCMSLLFPLFHSLLILYFMSISLLLLLGTIYYLLLLIYTCVYYLAAFIFIANMLLWLFIC